MPTVQEAHHVDCRARATDTIPHSWHVHLGHSAGRPLLHGRLLVGVLQQHAQLELVHLICQALLQERKQKYGSQLGANHWNEK